MPDHIRHVLLEKHRTKDWHGMDRLVRTAVEEHVIAETVRRVRRGHTVFLTAANEVRHTTLLHYFTLTTVLYW